jgi:hypothetical protein
MHNLLTGCEKNPEEYPLLTRGATLLQEMSNTHSGSPARERGDHNAGALSYAEGLTFVSETDMS